MKVILSRKGFDSQYGGMPSPILPDGTLLSLPIPAKRDTETMFVDLHYGDNSYYDIIHSLKPTTKIKEKYCCHLDPDIRESIIDRPNGWQPAFGQEGSSLRHLQKQGIGIGDLFLFFGWFKQTELIDGILSYVKGAPDLHIIYGYFQVGSIIDCPENIPSWLNQHPHTKISRWTQPNTIYITSPQLSLCPQLRGAECLPFSNKLVLTKQGCSRSIWNLPDFFRQIPITYNANSWKEDCFKSADKGQEFVFEANNDVKEWVKEIILA